MASRGQLRPPGQDGKIFIETESRKDQEDQFLQKQTAERRKAGNFRFLGFHILLGKVEKGVLGTKGQDEQKAKEE